MKLTYKGKELNFDSTYTDIIQNIKLKIGMGVHVGKNNHATAIGFYPLHGIKALANCKKQKKSPLAVLKINQAIPDIKLIICYKIADWNKHLIKNILKFVENLQVERDKGVVFVGHIFSKIELISAKEPIKYVGELTDGREFVFEYSERNLIIAIESDAGMEVIIDEDIDDNVESPYLDLMDVFIKFIKIIGIEIIVEVYPCGTLDCCRCKKSFYEIQYNLEELEAPSEKPQNWYFDSETLKRKIPFNDKYFFKVMEFLGKIESIKVE